MNLALPSLQRLLQLLLMLLVGLLTVIAIVVFGTRQLVNDQLRGHIAVVAADVAGLAIDIGEVRGSWWTGLTLRDVKIHETDSPQSGVLIAIPVVQVDYSLAGLFSLRPRPIRVDAYHPALTLRVGQDHQLAFRPKARPPEPMVKPAPPVDIVIHAGHIAYHDAGARKPFVAEVTHLTGRGELRDFDLALDLQALQDGDAIKANVAYSLKDMRGWVNAKAQGLALPYFVNRFGYAPEYTMTAGRADLDVVVGWQDPLDSRMSSLSLNGTVRLKDAEARIQNVEVPVRRLNGTVALSAQQAVLKDVTGELAGMPLRAEGTVSRLVEPIPALGMPDPVLALSVVAPDVALERLALPFPGLKPLALQGHGRVVADVSGTSFDPRVAMRGFVPSGHYGQESVQDFYIAANYRPGALDIPAWRLRAAGGKGQGTAWVGLNVPEGAPVPYRVAGRLAGADAAGLLERHLEQPPGLPLTGKLALAFDVEGVGTRAKSRADLALEGGTLGGRPVERLEAAYRYRTPRWEVPALTLRWADTRLDASLKGSDAGDIDIKATLQGAELAQLAALAPQAPAAQIKGRLSADGTLRGLAAKPETWSGEANVAVTDGRLGQQSVPAARAKLVLAGNQLSIKDGQASLMGGHLGITGEAAPAFDPQALKGRIHLEASGLDPAQLADMPEALAGLQGRANGRFDVSVEAGAWRAEGTAEAQRLLHARWGQLDGLEAKLVVDAGRVQLAPLTWRQGAERVTATGSVTLGAKPHLDLAIATREAEIATLLGAVNWPNVSRSLDPRALLAIRPTGPRRDRAALPERLTPIEDALVRLGPGLDHWLAWRKAPLDRPAPAPALVPFWEGTRGKLNLDMRLTGPVSAPAVALDATVEDLHVFERHLDAGSVQLGYAGSRLTLTHLRLSEDGQVVLTGGGAFSDRPRDTLVLRSHGLDLAWSRRALNAHKMRLDGRATAEIRLSGPWRDPRLEGTGTLSAGAFVGPGLEAIAFERIEADLAYAGGQLDIHRAKLRQNGHEATVAGSLPLAEGTRGSTAPIDLALRLEDGNLAIANLFSQGRFQWLGGKGVVDLRLGGTPLHPTLKGEIRLQDGRLTARGLDAPIEQIQANIRLEGDQMTITELRGHFGGGDVELGGSIALAEFQPQRFDLTAVARPFRLQLTNEYYQGTVEANLTLKGPVEQPLLSGSVALRDGVVTLRDGDKKDPAAPGAPELFPLRLNNLQIALGPNMRIKNAMIDINVTTQQRQGFLQVDGPLSAMRPYGVVIVEGGTIRPLNNTFTITEGRVEFAGEQVRTEDELMAILAPADAADAMAHMNAKLDITARTTLFDYEENVPISLQAHVTGTLQQMDMRFASEPMRSQQELLDMLSKKQVIAQTFNGKLDGGQVIVKEVGGFVTSNIEELISPYTLFLRNALNLHTFRIELVPDYEKDSTANIAGFKPALTLETRPMFERFSINSRLVVGQLYDTTPTTFGDHSYLGLNWRLDRHLGLQYRVDPFVDQLNQPMLNQTLGLKAQFSY